MTGGDVTKKMFFPFAGPFLQVPTGRLGVGQNEIVPGLAWQNRHEAGPHQIAYSQTGKLRLSLFDPCILNILPELGRPLGNF